jgi:hypothetical protein
LDSSHRHNLGQFTSEHESILESLKDDYLKKLDNFRRGRDALAHYSPPTAEQRYKKKLIQDIIDYVPLLQGVSITILSRLLLGGKDYTMIDRFLKADEKPQNLHKLFRIILNTNSWTVKSLAKYGIQATKSDIKNAQRHIWSLVQDWIYNAHLETGWDTMATLDKPEGTFRKGTDATTVPEYSLILNLWLAIATYKDNPDLSIGELGAELESSNIGTFLNKLYTGRSFWKSNLKRYLALMTDYITEESNKQNPDMNKLLTYNMARHAVGLYAAKRAIRWGVESRHAVFKGHKWDSEYVVAYHLMTDFVQTLGFDPLTFEIIDQRAYAVSRNTLQSLKQAGLNLYRYIRHHFRTTKAGRASFLYSDVITTDRKNHITWGLLSESKALAIIRGFETLVKIQGSGNIIPGTNIKAVTEDDIKNVFKNDMDVYYQWKLQGVDEFNDRLDDFNERRANIRSIPFEKFLLKYGNTIYERFYERVASKEFKRKQCLIRSDFISFLHELHSDLEFEELQASVNDHDAFASATMNLIEQLLKNEGYLIHVGII